MKYFKAVIDVVMMVMIVVLMAYTLTGNAIHEYLGVALFTLVLIHVALNRAWYRALPRMLPKMAGKPRQQARILCNLILTIATFVCAVTSVAISTDAFAFLNIPYLGDAWALVHTVSAFTMLVAGAIHFGFHGAFFKSLVQKKSAVHPRRAKASGAWVRQPIMGALSLLIAVFGVGMYESKLFFAAAAVREQSAVSASMAESAASDSSTPASSSVESGKASSPGSQASAEDAPSSAAEEADAPQIAEAEDSQETSSEQVAIADEAEEQVDPLEGQICTLCKKCCPLTAPMCGRGVQLAQQILAEQS